MIDHTDPRQYSEAVRGCWSVHQALRQLGFDAGDIYVATGKDARNPQTPLSLFVILRTQGKEFVVTLAGYPSEEAVEAELTQWSTFATLSNEGAFDEDVLDEIYQCSNVMQNKEQFVVALFSKGIRPSQQRS